MPNILDGNGLTTKTLQEIITELTTSLQTIYGADITVDSNSPDGQLINIEALTARDILTLLESINSSFDPDQAVGVVLDQRVAINNIRRAAATYTYQTIRVTVDRTLTLPGLDAAANDPDGTGFTVADSQGNQFILLDSQTPVAAGTYSYSFRAKNLGAVTTTINTITTIQTIIVGVTSVNNTVTQTSTGQNEETDFQLRERRKKSPAIRSKASLAGVEANLLSTTGVASAKVYENYTNVTDANGLPPHSMYAIVDGGSNADIGDVISKYRSVGCDMLGDVEVDVEISGQIEVMKFDRQQSVPLYIRFGLKATKAGQSFDLPAIKAYIVANKSFIIGEEALSDELTDIARAGVIETAGNTGTVVNLEISDDDTNWDYYIETTELKDIWNLSVDNIDITLL